MKRVDDELRKSGKNTKLIDSGFYYNLLIFKSLRSENLI